MSLLQLSLASFRNLKDATLDFGPGVNLIHGSNAAGKTALLESISIITQGKSFRTRHLSQCVRHGEDSFLLFARHDRYRSGFRYSPRKNEIRIDGEPARRIRELAHRSALLVIDEHSIDLVSGKPQHRRQFIDWLLFHVEPSYADLWAKTRYLLKQRNALLKQRKDLHLLDYWEPQLVDHTLKLHELRQSVLPALNETIGDYQVHYEKGFDTDYGDQLKSDRSMDTRMGYTRHHYNRADLLIRTLDQQPVNEVASRGQKKTLAVSLQTRAIELVKQSSDKPIIVLIDDLAAELDQDNLSKLYKTLMSLDCQLFVTGLVPDVFPDFLADRARMFHVEHGMIGATTA